jgi:hypothetical protein
MHARADTQPERDGNDYMPPAQWNDCDPSYKFFSTLSPVLWLWPLPSLKNRLRRRGNRFAK